MKLVSFSIGSKPTLAILKLLGVRAEMLMSMGCITARPEFSSVASRTQRGIPLIEFECPEVDWPIWMGFLMGHDFAKFECPAAQA